MKKIIAVFLLLNGYTALSQVDCATTDINKIPGKWRWEKDGTAAQWQYTDPIRQELMRILPAPMEGLIGKGSIAFWEKNTFFQLPSPRFCEFYLQLKKYECLSRYNQLQPEAVTGCWVYFIFNNIDGQLFPVEVESAIADPLTDRSYTAVNFRIEMDAAGNQLIYTSNKPGIFRPHCYYFSGNKDFPRKRITNRVLFGIYKRRHEKKANEKILSLEKVIATHVRDYNRLSAKEKADQPYWLENEKRFRADLEKAKTEREVVLNWYINAMQRDDLDSLAYVQTINPYLFTPGTLIAEPGMGFAVWEDNAAFFDPKKSKDEPQCISLYIRRQDEEIPKKKFMDLFFNEFNLDVLAKMAGEKPKKPMAINSLNQSIAASKLTGESANNALKETRSDFQQSSPGTFPAGWDGTNTVRIRKIDGKNQLALDKPGYWYPKQFNQEIKNGFSLSLDMGWDKAMPYYGGLFTVSFSSVLYDNPSSSYRTDLHPSSFWSLYDSYAGNFNRVVCWLDAHGNNAGSLQVISYSHSETQVVNKKITLPDFFGQKNSHTLKFERKANNLLVYINGQKEAEVENAFIPSVRYNLYTLSRYKGTNDPKDVFYLSTIKTQYQ